MVALANVHTDVFLSSFLVELPRKWKKELTCMRIWQGCIIHLPMSGCVLGIRNQGSSIGPLWSHPQSSPASTWCNLLRTVSGCCPHKGIKYRLGRAWHMRMCGK